MQEVEVPPEPQLMESMRAVGYNLETAIADIVDNSIAARASSVEIFFDSNVRDQFTIVDDGLGMTRVEVINAMRLANKSSNQDRSGGDLGRFGLGLKTASLSQCRQLIVITKKNSSTSAFMWDLDRLAKTGRWSLMELSQEDILQVEHSEIIVSRQNGTLVAWRKLDQLISEVGDSSRTLDTALMDMKRHLGLVFHRYLASEHGRPFTIHVNGRMPDRVDPFLQNNRATQIGPSEKLNVAQSEIVIQPYTLPFSNKLTRSDRMLCDTGVTLKDSQGFYIYRELRLVIWGTWFKMTPRDDLGRLARVKVDVPNSLDDLWSLDIKKSSAVPPPQIREALRRIVTKIIGPSRAAHEYRGRPQKQGDKVVRFWDLIVDRGEFRYEISRQHPLIVALESQLDRSSRASLDEVLTVAQNTFPIRDAFNRLAKDQEVSESTYDLDNLRALADHLLEVFIKTGGSKGEFIEIFKHVEPFNSIASGIPILQEVANERIN